MPNVEKKELFKGIVKGIEANTMTSGYFQRFELTDDDIDKICLAMRYNTSVISLDVSRNTISDESAAKLAKVLAYHPVLKTFDAYHADMSDAAAESFADALRINRSICDVTLSNNAFGPNGIAALEDAIIGGRNKNLFRSIVDEEPLSSYGRDNHVRATFYAETLQTLQPIVLQFPILWYNVAERLPAIREIARARGFAIEENLKELDAHIEANVPKLDPDAPLTMEALMRKDGDFAPIDHPDIWLKWDQTLAALNANGEQFQAGELLHEDRKRPSPLLKRALEYGVADQFFTYENWRDAPKADLSATLAAIPEGVRKAIPNLQQLIAAISKDERALQRGIA